MMNDDDEPTPDELREAEELARALERGNAPAGVPEDALAAAALLRVAKDGGALPPERSEAILSDVLARVRPREAARRPRLRTTILGLLGLTAAGVASLVLVARSPGPDGTAELPAPPRALLMAQVAAASDRTRGLDAVTTETASYRVAVYSSLRERYGK